MLGVEADHETALKLAIELDHTIYDCLYLALALRLETRVITADRKFHAAIHRSKRFGGIVNLLDQFDPAALN